MIVADYPGLRHLIGSVVLPLTSDICECADYRSAVTVYGEYRPDLVLMDIQMKDLGGIKVMKQIREVHRTARIVLLSDYDDDELRAAAIRAGACGYALKDNLLDLVQVLNGIEQK